MTHEAISDYSMEFIAATQSAMADTLATQSQTLADISKTLVSIHVEAAKTEREIINILKDNQDTYARVSRLEKTSRQLEITTNVNKFAMSSVRVVFGSLCAAVVFGGSIVYMLYEVVGKAT